MGDEHEKISQHYLEQMRKQIESYKDGSLALPKLVENLRGLFEASDVYRDPTRTEFEDVWSQISYQWELRSESWAPSDWIKESELDDAIQHFESWLESYSSVDGLQQD